MRAVILILTIALLVSFATPQVSTREVQPPKFDEYVDLPFNKFVNRMFLDEVRDKYAKIESDFGYLHSSQNVGGYPADKWIRITIIKGSMAYDNVMVPKSEAEICFDLVRGEPITVYAKTTV